MKNATPASHPRGEGSSLAQRLGFALDAARLGVLLRLDLLEVLEVAGGGAERELFRDQIVARVSVGDVTDLAAAPDLGDVVEQDHSHCCPSTPSPDRARGPPCGRA